MGHGGKFPDLRRFLSILGLQGSGGDGLVPAPLSSWELQVQVAAWLSGCPQLVLSSQDTAARLLLRVDNHNSHDNDNDADPAAWL